MRNNSPPVLAAVALTLPCIPRQALTYHKSTLTNPKPHPCLFTLLPTTESTEATLRKAVLVPEESHPYSARDDLHRALSTTLPCAAYLPQVAARPAMFHPLIVFIAINRKGAPAYVSHNRTHTHTHACTAHARKHRNLYDLQVLPWQMGTPPILSRDLTLES